MTAVSDLIGRVLARLARVRSRRQGIGETDPGAPVLQLRPTTGVWYVRHGDDWFEPVSDADVDTLLAVLPLRILEDDTEDPRPLGFVRVLERAGRTTLEFLAPYGEHVVRIAELPENGPAPVVEWTRGHHDDGWVETVASLHLDGVRRCDLEVFLPEGPGDDKLLAVVGTDGPGLTYVVHPVRRGRVTRVPVYASVEPAAGVTVTLQSSAPEAVDDARALGVFVREIQARR